MILNLGVPQGLDRYDPWNRRVWDLVGRVFNAWDMDDYVAPIVEERRRILADLVSLRANRPSAGRVVA